jgi:hypothetical protein
MEEAAAEMLTRGLLTEEEARNVAAVRPDQQVTTPLVWIMNAYTDRITNDPKLNGEAAAAAAAAAKVAGAATPSSSSSFQGAADKKLAKVTEFVLAMRTGAMDTLTAVSSFGAQPLPLAVLMSALIKLDLA